MSDIQTTAAPDGWKPTGGAGTVPKLVVPTHIDGLSGEENALLRELAEVWTRPARRNRTLTAYYEAKEPLVDFGLTVPKSIKDHYTPLGWARKAVDMPVSYTHLDVYKRQIWLFWHRIWKTGHKSSHGKEPEQ